MDRMGWRRSRQSVIPWTVEMRATVSALREEITALRQEHKASAEGGGATVSREEYEKCHE